MPFDRWDAVALLGLTCFCVGASIAWLPAGPMAFGAVAFALGVRNSAAAPPGAAPAGEEQG